LIENYGKKVSWGEEDEGMRVVVERRPKKHLKQKEEL